MLLKVVEAKKLLESGKVKTAAEAASRLGISRSSFYRTADARSHELRYVDQGASAQILCPGHKNLPGTVPVRAPDRFPRFQQKAANDRQTFGSYRYGNNVSLASAQEDSRGSPATANVTGSRILL